MLEVYSDFNILIRIKSVPLELDRRYFEKKTNVEWKFGQRLKFDVSILSIRIKLLLLPLEGPHLAFNGIRIII